MTDSWIAGLPPESAAELRAGFDADAEAYQRTEVQQDYLAVGFRGSPPPPPEQIPPWHFPPEAEPYFTETAAGATRSR